ncbi:hypothetical protein F4782DRAFT_533026 [Xylaria castorea]|nr:hypothetical protein F4782DRAFT_533026 [Xylaria castorea]
MRVTVHADLHFNGPLFRCKVQDAVTVTRQEVHSPPRLPNSQARSLPASPPASPQPNDAAHERSIIDFCVLHHWFYPAEPEVSAADRRSALPPGDPPPRTADSTQHAVRSTRSGTYLETCNRQHHSPTSRLRGGLQPPTQQPPRLSSAPDKAQPIPLAFPVHLVPELRLSDPVVAVPVPAFPANAGCAPCSTIGRILFSRPLTALVSRSLE